MAVHSVHCQAAPLREGEAREALSAFLADLASRLEARGCKFVGHIKGMAVAPGSEPVWFSLTHLEGTPEFKGASWTGKGDWELSVSAILAGMSEEEIELTMRETMEAHFLTGGEAKQ